MWDLSAGDPTGRPRELRGREGAAKSVSISDGVESAVTGSEDRTARLWSHATGDASVDPIVQPGSQAHFSADSRWLVSDYRDRGSGSSDGTVRVWNLSRRDTVALPRTLNISSGPNDLLVSPDTIGWWPRRTDRKSKSSTSTISTSGRSTSTPPFAIAVSATTADGSLRARFKERFASGRLAKLADGDARPIVLDGHVETVFELGFSPDHRWLGSVDSEERTLLWDLATGAAPSPPAVAGARPLAFSPWSHWLATSDGRVVHVWDLTQPGSAPIDVGGPGDRMGLDGVRSVGPGTGVVSIDLPYVSARVVVAPTTPAGPLRG